MPGREHGAAVLVGQDGGFVGANFVGNIDDLHLIQTDQGTEHGNIGDFVGAGESLHGLAGHLTDTLTGDQRLSPFLMGDGIGQTHHVAAHDDGGVIRMALFVNLHLDIGKGNHMHLDAAQAFGQNSSQIQHLFLGALAGVGRRIEVHRAHADAAFGDHPASHRAVNAAGQQQGSTAIGAHRHAAHRHDGLGVHVCLIADLHGNHQLRIVHIHRQVGALFQHIMAHFHVDGRRIHEVALIAAAGVHLEGAVVILHQLNRGLADGVEVILGQFQRAAQAMHAEHLAHLADALVHVGQVTDIDTAVAEPHMAAQFFDRIADALHQHPHEIRTVGAFQKNLAEANLQNLTHRAFFLS